MIAAAAATAAIATAIAQIEMPHVLPQTGAPGSHVSLHVLHVGGQASGCCG